MARIKIKKDGEWEVLGIGFDDLSAALQARITELEDAWHSIFQTGVIEGGSNWNMAINHAIYRCRGKGVNSVEDGWGLLVNILLDNAWYFQIFIPDGGSKVYCRRSGADKITWSQWAG